MDSIRGLTLCNWNKINQSFSIPRSGVYACVIRSTYVGRFALALAHSIRSCQRAERFVCHRPPPCDACGRPTHTYTLLPTHLHTAQEPRERWRRPLVVELST